MTFEQEASQKHKLATLGTPADFKAGLAAPARHLQPAGVTNAVWTWVMTGAHDNLHSAGPAVARKRLRRLDQLERLQPVRVQVQPDRPGSSCASRTRC